MMKNRKYSYTLLLCAVTLFVSAQQLKKEAFGLLNLDYPGLEEVKTACTHENWEQAASALLDYYRARTAVKHPGVDLQHITLSKEERKWADDALEHTFFVHKGYQPSYNYGKDIDWQYWPVRDNELRWQLHRHKWFTPMGKAYRLTGDEKYGREWTLQYLDWIRKNPLVPVEQEAYELASAGEVKGTAENVCFAWRPLEVSNRLEDQTAQFLLFLPSPSFNPAFLTEFLVNYHRHAVHILGNYSAQGNHLLFEAQRMVYAGAFFPEFKEAAAWRESGIGILNREIEKQVYPDGGQYELDPHYHLAAINIFCKALRMADINGFRNEFPAGYIGTVKRMIEFYANICFPDYSNPCFSDAKSGERQAEIRNYKQWLALFPDCEWIRYYATEGREGKPLPYLCRGALASGFFTFRNGWEQDATVMVVKAGPKGEWHCQPDNGTFELWFNGKNLFPDSGSYVYAGDDEVMKLRNWFRQTRVHNTLTLDGKNTETTQSVTRLWKPDGDTPVLATENPHYNGLKHRRTVFFAHRRYFVIVDEAIGDATGTVNLNYHLAEGPVNVDAGACSVTTAYEGASNVRLQCFSDKALSLKQEEGWRSPAYRKRVPRASVSVDAEKNDAAPVRYITVIYPAENASEYPVIRADFPAETVETNRVRVTLLINGKKQTFACRFQEDK